MNEYGIFPRVDIAVASSPDGLRDLTVLSPALGRRADITLYATPGAESLARAPLVILLHGVYGSHWAWARSGRAHLTARDLVAERAIAPVILAMPSDGLFGIGSGYIPRIGEDSEAWIIDEVPAAARLVFPNVDVDDVSIAGLSMGGWGALRLAARRPGRFRAAVGMSPLTRLSQVAGFAPSELGEEHVPPPYKPELADLLASVAERMCPLRITCGTEDDLITDVRALHHALDEADVDHTYIESAGGHDWEYWAGELTHALKFIDRRILRPSAPAIDSVRSHSAARHTRA